MYSCMRKTSNHEPEHTSSSLASGTLHGSVSTCLRNSLTLSTSTARNITTCFEWQSVLILVVPVVSNNVICAYRWKTATSRIDPSLPLLFLPSPSSCLSSLAGRLRWHSLPHPVLPHKAQSCTSLSVSVIPHMQSHAVQVEYYSPFETN